MEVVVDGLLEVCNVCHNENLVLEPHQTDPAREKPVRRSRIDENKQIPNDYIYR